jgi:glycosyltransferase involved in cell wall biosynthesis
MITVLAVGHNTLDWLRLLVQSVRAFRGHVPTDIVIVDNASSDGSREWLEKQDDVFSYPLPENIGHGRGLDFGLRQVMTRFALILDIDAHLQRAGWDADFIKLYQLGANQGRRLIAAKGGEAGDPIRKPIHPCMMFFEARFFVQNQLLFWPRDGYDVGRKIYYDLVEAGHEVHRVDAGYESHGAKFYPGVFGTEYYIFGKPTVFHAWYGARMADLPLDGSVDGYKKADFERDKELVFSQPLVKEIMAYGRK